MIASEIGHRDIKLLNKELKGKCSESFELVENNMARLVGTLDR